jgi:hypothetical protein
MRTKPSIRHYPMIQSPSSLGLASTQEPITYLQLAEQYGCQRLTGPSRQV